MLMALSKSAVLVVGHSPKNVDKTQDHGPSKPKPSSAQICNLLLSPTRAWLGFSICHQADPDQASIGKVGRKC